MLTVGGEGGSRKVKMLTVVDDRRGGRVERKNLQVLRLTVERKLGLKKTKLLTLLTVGRDGG